MGRCTRPDLLPRVVGILYYYKLEEIGLATGAPMSAERRRWRRALLVVSTTAYDDVAERGTVGCHLHFCAMCGTWDRAAGVFRCWWCQAFHV